MSQSETFDNWLLILPAIAATLSPYTISMPFNPGIMDIEWKFWLYATDAYKHHGCTLAWLQPWALSVVRVGHPLVTCVVLFNSSLGAECNKCEKPRWLLIDSITKVTYSRLQNSCNKQAENWKTTIELQHKIMNLIIFLPILLVHTR